MMPNTEQRAPLGERLISLAQEFQRISHATPHTTPPSELVGDGMANGQLGAYLRDHAYSLMEFAQQLEDEYVRLSDAFPNGITVAQGVALARFMGREDAMFVTRGGQGLEPDEYLLVQLDPFQPGTAGEVATILRERLRRDGKHPYTGGIDREGRTNT